MSTNVTEALADLLAAGETGVQVAAYHRDRLVLDESAGTVRAGGDPVRSDTIFFVASAGKVSTAAALHRQVERGLVDYDQTVASLWPEFGTGGKEHFTVREALTHAVGLADLPPDATAEDMGDWDWMVDRLAGTRPTDDPAARHAYHARTWGYLVGEIARRADPGRRAFEEIVRREVHEPLGITEVYHRVPAELDGRVAVVTGDVFSGEPVVFTVTEDHEFNDPAQRRRIDPNGGWMTARSGARLWSLYANGGAVDGIRVLDPGHVQSFLRHRSSDLPAGWMAGRRAVIGAGGLMLGGAVPGHHAELGFAGDRVLWHPGAGGAMGFADLDARLAVMICHNELFDERLRPEHPFAPLVRAVYADLELTPA